MKEVSSGNDVIMDELKEITKRMAQIERNVDILRNKLDEMVAKYLEDKLRLQAREARLKFIKETEKALDNEAKQYYGGE